MKFQQKPLLVSPDCQQLQKLVLDIMKSESLHDAVASSHWSPTILDFVRSLSHKPIPHLKMVGSNRKEEQVLTQAAFVFEHCSQQP